MRGIASADPAAQYFKYDTSIDAAKRQRSWSQMVCGCGAAFLAGMTVFAVFLFARLSNLGNDFARVTTLGQADLSLDPGTYTIFHEQAA
jgi:hypothetical protein